MSMERDTNKSQCVYEVYSGPEARAIHVHVGSSSTRLITPESDARTHMRGPQRVYQLSSIINTNLSTCTSTDKSTQS